MTVDEKVVCIETDSFLFEAPDGFQVTSLDEEAELLGANQEFLVVSSYSIDDTSSDEVQKDFMNNIADAMKEAADEPDLIVNGKLTKNTTESGMAVYSVLAGTSDKSHFFDQYAVINKTTAVVTTIEGDIENRICSAKVEEAIHAVEFK